MVRAHTDEKVHTGMVTKGFISYPTTCLLANMSMCEGDEARGEWWGGVGRQVKESKAPKAQNLFEFIAPGGEEDRLEESAAWEGGGGWQGSEREARVANEFPVRVVRLE